MRKIIKKVQSIKIDWTKALQNLIIKIIARLIVELAKLLLIYLLTR